MREKNNYNNKKYNITQYYSNGKSFPLVVRYYKPAKINELTIKKNL